MSGGVKENLKDVDTWKRFGFMVIFAVVYNVAEIVLLAVVLLQVVLTLFTGARNERLLRFGAQLSTFIYQIMTYLTYNSEIRPFPFAEWPDSKATEEGSATIG